MKSFSQWTIAEVEKEFQIEWQDLNDLLESWLNYTESDSADDLTQMPVQALKRLQTRLIKHVHGWNERELQVKFIAQILDMVEFDQDGYQSFLERVISAPYKDDTLSGDVDFIVAKGRWVPEQPFFFLHEYKKDVNSSGDPLGQLMIAMVAAQILNQGDRPIYGSYVVGRFWYFVVLEGQKYAVSLAYDATKDEIKDIFYILEKIKTIILKG